MVAMRRSARTERSASVRDRRAWRSVADSRRRAWRTSFLRKRKSSLLIGVGEDATIVADKIAATASRAD
jgi:hypothetical protein